MKQSGKAFIVRGLTRRQFIGTATAIAIAGRFNVAAEPSAWTNPHQEVELVERRRVLRNAQAFLAAQPKTITAVRAARSTGDLHDYFSEGDYWWPDPKSPNGPYIRRDGESNPDNFVAHRELLIRLSLVVPTLTAAWILTGKIDFAEHAASHLNAWFVAAPTRMNANLEYAQAIHGITPGRSIGIIDTVHLVEVARSAQLLEEKKAIDADIAHGTRRWFKMYLNWLTTSIHGREERDAKNNHGSCWLLQAATFATYTKSREVRAFCLDRFERSLIPSQIAANGSFPLELARTKPYSYSLFDLDILGMCSRVLSDGEHDLWAFHPDGGSGLKEAFAFYYPYVKDKSKWPYRHDVEYFDDLPVRQPCWLFAGLAYRKPEYLALWQELNPNSKVPEVIRNNPVRQPLLWM